MSQVALGPGEDGDAGSVAVLNAAGAELAVIDKAGAVANVSGGSASIKVMDSADFDAKYADLLAGLPTPPRTFVLYFKENSIEPTEESQALMAEIFAEIKKRAGADLEITGHTDTVGPEDVNDAFSLRRAAGSRPICSPRASTKRLFGSQGAANGNCANRRPMTRRPRSTAGWKLSSAD